MEMKLNITNLLTYVLASLVVNMTAQTFFQAEQLTLIILSITVYFGLKMIGLSVIEVVNSDNDNKDT